MPERVPIEVLSTEAGWSLLSVLDEEYGELTEDEQRAVAQTVLDREDLWGSESDTVWDTLPA